MAETSPMETVKMLINAINRGDLETALAQYEPQATMVTEPGKLAHGTDQLRIALEGFISLKPSLRSDGHQVVDGGGLALYCSRWHLTGTAPDGQPVEMGGTSSDVLRKQSDGSWRIVIDNPWGTGIL